MKTKATFTFKDAAAYFLLLFVTLLLVGILLGEFFGPIKQYLMGESVDFAAHWQQVDFTRRIGLALVISLAFTFYKSRKERKKEEESEVEKSE